MLCNGLFNDHIIEYQRKAAEYLEMAKHLYYENALPIDDHLMFLINKLSCTVIIISGDDSYVSRVNGFIFFFY